MADTKIQFEESAGSKRTDYEMNLFLNQLASALQPFFPNSLSTEPYQHNPNIYVGDIHENVITYKIFGLSRWKKESKLGLLSLKLNYMDQMNTWYVECTINDSRVIPLIPQIKQAIALFSARIRKVGKATLIDNIDPRKTEQVTVNSVSIDLLDHPYRNELIQIQSVLHKLYRDHQSAEVVKAISEAETLLRELVARTERGIAALHVAEANQVFQEILLTLSAENEVYPELTK